MYKTCCFAGHMPKSFPWGNDEHASDCCELKDTLFLEIEKAVQNGYGRFIIGMTQGFDIYVGETLILCKRIYPHITLEAAVPYANHTKSWPKTEKLRYKNILSRCDQKTIINKAYTPQCIKSRNKYMLDNSSLLIATWNGKSNEVGSAVKYALRKKVKIYLI